MIIFPAIDIKDGRCVRLYQGDYSTATQVADSVPDTAKAFAKAGARWVHMVDLDGAKAGKPVNTELFLRIASETGLRVQLGGGIRDLDTVRMYLENGVSRVILGSAAISNPDFVREAVTAFGEKIAVGIDARDGMAAAQGWTETSAVHYLRLAKEMEKIGVKHLIFTDIARDGTLTGPETEQLTKLQETVSCNIIASGGIRDIEDIRVLSKMNLYGAICGKSLYSGSLELAQAIREGARLL